MVGFAVAIEGIESFTDLQKLGPDVKVATVRAINKVARDTRALAARQIGEQINLPKRVLGPAAGNLVVSKQAQRASLEARIKARGRPTSLARFTKGSPGRAGVTVEVKPGQARFLRRAFLIRLPQGSSLTETRFNLGLAIRLRPGETLDNKTNQVRLSKGLYLLYGPSVQQVFLDNQNKGVARDLEPSVGQDLENEIIRLLGLRR